jgi:hypothetical protein
MSERHPRPVVLVITHSNDNESIPLVMHAVAEKGGVAYRVDTNRFPTDIRLSSQYSGDEERQVVACEDYELDLNYGAADFIVTPDGRHCFLEVNPVGEFFWLEKHPGLPLSGAIADLLVSGKRGS